MRVSLDLAAAIGEVSKGTIRQWVNRGVINRYDDGYETAELLLWLDQERSQWAMDLRQGLPEKRKTA